MPGGRDEFPNVFRRGRVLLRPIGKIAKTCIAQRFRDWGLRRCSAQFLPLNSAIFRMERFATGDEIRNKNITKKEAEASFLVWNGTHARSLWRLSIRCRRQRIFKYLKIRIAVIDFVGFVAAVYCPNTIKIPIRVSAISLHLFSRSAKASK